MIPGQDGLYVHIHGPNLTGVILLHPQLSVFGGIQVLQQLVDWLHRLETHKHLHIWYIYSISSVLEPTCYPQLRLKSTPTC